MEIAGATYFWQRGPHWLRQLGGVSLGGAAAVALLVGALAFMAQSAADHAGPVEHYSLSMHVLAMTALGALSVAVATALAGLGRPELAAVVLVATAGGPMTLVAAPVRASLVDASLSDTKLWWRLAVGVAVLAVLGAWTALCTRCLADRDRSPGGVAAEGSAARLPVADLLFTLVAAAAVLAYLEMPQQANEPGFLPVVGWAVLAAGLTVAVAHSRRWWWAPAAFGAVALVLALVFLAYTRLGGWPGVAGWEYNGMESPIITSVASTVAVLAAVVLGAALRAVGQPGGLLRLEIPSAG